MDSLFFYGTLRHRPVLDMVLGDTAHLTVLDAELPGHAVHWARDQAFPLIRECEGGVARGLLVQGLSVENVARLDFYEGAFDYALLPVTVNTATGAHATRVYFPDAGRWDIGPEWSLEDWVRDWAEITLIAGAEAMAQFGRISAADLVKSLPQMRVRAASRLRAQTSVRSTPLRQRQKSRPDIGDLRTHDERTPYVNYFAIAENDLQYPRFDGSLSPRVTLAAFRTGDAVSVLPYDPVRDRVLVIEQFRFGAHMRGDPVAWTLEPVAGRIDPGEDPETAARREAQEETGLTLGALERIAGYYPSPGAVTEFLISYVGIADLPDGIAGIGGQEDEAEDIRGHLLSFDELMGAVQSGEADTGPLVVSALWLAGARSRLRKAALPDA